MRSPGVGGRDDPVAIAPHDQRREVGREVEPIEGADVLAVRLDHGPHRAHERLAVLGSGQRAVGAQHLTKPRRLKPAAPQEPAHVADPIGDPPREQDGHHLLGERQGKDAEQPAHLAAETATADEHQSVAQLRVLVGELHRHPTAEGVTDHGRARNIERGEQVPQPAGVGAQRVVTHRLRRVPVTHQVGSEDVIRPRERRHDVLPRTRATRQPVDQHDGLASAGPAVSDRMTMHTNGAHREPITHDTHAATPRPIGWKRRWSCAGRQPHATTPLALAGARVGRQDGIDTCRHASR